MVEWGMTRRDSREEIGRILGRTLDRRYCFYLCPLYSLEGESEHPARAKGGKGKGVRSIPVDRVIPAHVSNLGTQQPLKVKLPGNLRRVVVWCGGKGRNARQGEDDNEGKGLLRLLSSRSHDHQI